MPVGRSGWADVSQSAAAMTKEALPVADLDPDFEFRDILRVRADRDKRLRVIQCMSAAVKHVESLVGALDPRQHMLHTDAVQLSDAFERRVSAAISNYEREFKDRFALKDAIAPPKNLLVTVKMLTDLGSIVTESGHLVLNKNSIVSGNRADLIHLVRAGNAELLH